MSVFFLIVFAIYGGMHAYAFHRAHAAFGFGYAVGTALAIFMLFMVFSPFLIRALEGRDFETLARVLAWVAWTWLAVLFLFDCSALVLDLVNLIASLARHFGLALPLRLVPARLEFFLCLGISLMACVYGYAAAWNIQPETVRIETTKLPQGMDHFTIVQITDVHLGLIVRCDRLDRILSVVRAAKPDLLVSTGDLVDAQINHLPGMVERFRSIDPPYGKIAITGNHEFYAGIKKAMDFTEAAGFTVLRNRAEDIGPIEVAGVDDHAAVQLKLEAKVPDASVLAGLDHKKFVLFLKHQPTPDKDAIGLFDLMLSGHTHDGQIWPFYYIVKATYPYIAGTYDLGKGSLLHTSRGTGTWGPPIRVFAPPEVTVIELVRKKGA